MTLDKLPVGQSGVIQTVAGEGALRRRLLDMGLTPGTNVTLHKKAPMGDPVVIELRGYSLTLRLEDAANVALADAEALGCGIACGACRGCARGGKRHAG